MSELQHKKLLEVEVDGAMSCIGFWNIRVPVDTDDADVHEIIDLIAQVYDGFEFKQVGKKMFAAYGRANALCVAGPPQVASNPGVELPLRVIGGAIGS